MDWKDLQTCEKTIRSYRKALAAAFKIVPRVELPNNWHSALPVELSPGFGIGAQALIPAATGVRVAYESLLSWGRPNTNGNTLEYSYFSVTPYIDIPYESFGWNAGIRHMADETTGVRPKDTPAKIVATPAYIRIVHWGHAPIKYGLIKFRQERKKIGQLFKDCADEKVRAQYLKAFEEASAEVLRWETAIKKEAAATKALLA